MKKIVKISVVLAIAMLISLMAVATVSATSDMKNEKTNTGITIDSKEKVAKVKITFNANGGKIGSKKTVATSVKKGAKLKKLAVTPKRAGYTFQGWFSKKSGGKKISKNTKVSKKTTFYANWKKQRALTTAEKKLVGFWSNDGTKTKTKEELRKDGTYVEFKKDGTFTRQYFLTMSFTTYWIFTHRVKQTGLFKIVGDKIVTSNVLETNVKLPTMNVKYPKEYTNKQVKNEGWVYKFSNHHNNSNTLLGEYLWITHYSSNSSLLSYVKM